MRRILHTMIRVSDLQASVDFYQNVLKMKVLRRFDNPAEQYTLVFLGYGPESRNAAIELTFNYGTHTYDRGNAFGHIAILVDDCFQACADVTQLGGLVSMRPKRLPGLGQTIAFIADPDGYQIELIEESAGKLSSYF